MNNTPEEQLRELIRQVIREELKSREIKKDPETGVTTSHLEDPEGTRVGYMKHTPTGVVGRLGPKAAEKEVEEARLSPDDAKKILDKHDAHDDFHALKSDKVSALLGAAKDAKYRRRSDAPGSKGRMFHQHLTRLAGKVKEGTAVATDAPDPNEEPKKGEEKPTRIRRPKDKRSIEQKSRDMGQIEMFEQKLKAALMERMAARKAENKE